MEGITACESKVTSSEEPSGAALATCAAPIEPAAPDLFSTITTRLSLLCSGACSIRASASVEPPGGNGTTSVMVVVDCAHTGPAANAAAPASTSRLVIFIVPSKIVALVVLRLFLLRLCRSETRAGLFIFRPRRTEDVKHAGALRSSAHRVRNVARRPPEIALLHLDLFIALDPDGGAFQQNAPLFLGVVMQGSRGVRRQGHHRQHGVLTGKDPRRHPRREFAQQAVDRMIEIVEFAALAHLFPPRRHCCQAD